jgi:30S ribosomal protein S31
VGKGDRKTRRGKIYAGSFGKLRPKDPAKAKRRAQAAKGSTRIKSTARK